MQRCANASREEDRMSTVHHEIRQFLCQAGHDLSSLSETDSLLEAGILDSLGVLELVGFLERRYDISVSDEEMMPEHFDSLGAISAFVARKSSWH
jgi:acyl carrier protein